MAEHGHLTEQPGWSCGLCGKAVTIPNHAAWPQQCPHCKAWHPVFEAVFTTQHVAAELASCRDAKGCAARGICTCKREKTLREKIEGPAAVREVHAAAEQLGGQVDLWFGDRKPAGIGSAWTRLREAFARLDEIRRGDAPPAPSSQGDPGDECDQRCCA